MPRPTRSLAEIVAPGRCALLFIEAQRGILGVASGVPALAEAARSTGAIANMARLAEAARAAGVPVVHGPTGHFPGPFGRAHNTPISLLVPEAGTPAATDPTFADPIEELGPEAGDAIVVRPYGLSHLTTTHLDAMLRAQCIDTVVVAGVSLNVAVTNLVLELGHRAYRVVVPSDAVVGFPVEYGEQVVRYTLRMLATIATTGELVAAWR